MKQYKLPVIIQQPSEETENKYMAALTTRAFRQYMRPGKNFKKAVAARQFQKKYWSKIQLW